MGGSCWSLIRGRSKRLPATALSEYSDEVKITDFGKESQDPCGLQPNVKADLAQFCFGASKATAHLTEGSHHKLNDDNGAIFIRGCKLIDDLVTKKLGDKLESEECEPKACRG